MEAAQQELGESDPREPWLRRNALGLGLWSTVALGAFLRFFLIGDKPIWLDEALTIEPARLSLAGGWHWLVSLDAHPPLYYLLLHVWLRLFGDGPTATRSLSAICGTLTLPIFYATARRMLRVASDGGELRAPRMDRRVALLATFILAVSPFHVRFGQEVRMYAFITLLVTVNLYVLSRLLFDERPARSLWWGLAGSEAAVMLTHNTAPLYPLALNVGALGALVLYAATGTPVSASGEGGRPFLLRWIRFQALALLLWSPWIIPLVRQSSALYQRHWIPFPTFRIVWRVIENFSFSSIPKGFPYLSCWISLYLLLALAGVIYLRRRQATALLLLALLVSPLVAEVLVSLKRPMLLDRTLIWTTLAYYMLMAAGIFGAGAWLRRGSAWVPRTVQALLLAVVIALSFFALRHYYRDYKKEGWDAAAGFIAHRLEPGDLIVFNTILGQVPLEYYFRNYHKQVEMRGLPVDLEERPLPEPTMTAGDVPYARRLLQGRRRVWLVYSHEAYTDPDRLVWRVLGDQMRQGATRGFVGLNVTLFSARERPSVVTP
jgi:mannosyltransferase